MNSSVFVSDRLGSEAEVQPFCKGVRDTVTAMLEDVFPSSNAIYVSVSIRFRASKTLMVELSWYQNVQDEQD